MEITSEGRKVLYRLNPANQNHVIVVNDAQVELTHAELMQIAAHALTPAEKTETKQPNKKGN